MNFEGQEQKSSTHHHLVHGTRMKADVVWALLEISHRAYRVCIHDYLWLHLRPPEEAVRIVS